MPWPRGPRFTGSRKWLILGVIAYEIAAKVSQYTPGPELPTWTALNHGRPLVGSVLTAGLGWHFRPLKGD